MSKLDPSDLAALGLDELHELVAALLERVAALETENAALRDENARLKGLKGRPKIKPSGMEAKAGASTTTTSKRRGKGMRRADGSSKNSRRVLAVSEEQRLEVEVPPGSRFKGFEDFVVQDLRLEGRVIRYRRERWLTPDGRTVTAPLPARLCGHFGPELVRFVILQHVQGQVTTERLTAMLNEIGIVISKRQVIRLLNGDPGGLNGEAAQLFRAGLETANWITVDDTGARHGACSGVTTQIGDGRFTHFATTFSKSRRNFLELLRAGGVEPELAQLEEAGWLAALLSGEEPAPEAWRGDARRSEGNLAVAADHVPGPGQLRQWADYLEGLFDRMGEFLDEY